MIVAGASLLGQILANRTSPGLVPARAASAPAEASVPARPGPTLASVTMSLSTLDALFALRISSRGASAARAVTDAGAHESISAEAVSARPAAPSSDHATGSRRNVATLMGGQTVVDPDLVREITAALESQKSRSGSASLTGTSHRSTGSLDAAYLAGIP